MSNQAPKLTVVEALRAVPPQVARHLRMIPLRRDGDTLVAGTVDPDDVRVQDALARLGGGEIAVEAASEELVAEIIRAWYGSTGDLFELCERLHASPIDATETTLAAGDDPAESPAVQIVDLLLKSAIEERATDVHIEPHPDRPRVRFRVDGMLVDRPAPPAWLAPRAIARVKALANLDLGDCLYAQDGQFTTQGPNGTVDLRVSILPADRGETAVLRLLGLEGEVPPPASLGLDAAGEAKLVDAAEMPDGLIILAGPTGSGKTTTLHSLLAQVDCERRNVVSIEEPVEIRTRRIRQVPVRRQTGLDFAGALRVILRQDPDVILVGETRDTETAQLAVQAALAGHLVLTTVHASTAMGVFDRLDQLGGDRRLVAETVRVVVSQRLLRTICDQCAGGGCFRCEGSGLRGRTGAYEVLALDSVLRRRIAEGASAAELLDLAREGGHETLQQVGQRLAEKGVTTAEEVRRVIGIELDADPTPPRKADRGRGKVTGES